MRGRLGLSPEELAARGVFVVQPGFRILALANPPTAEEPWLSNEVRHYRSPRADNVDDARCPTIDSRRRVHVCRCCTSSTSMRSGWSSGPRCEHVLAYSCSRDSP